MKVVAALRTTWRRFARARTCRRVIGLSGASFVVVGGLAIAMGAGWRPTVEIAVLLVGGVGSLLAHEFAHAFAHQLLYPGRSWAVEGSGFSLSVVIEQPVDGRRRAVIAAAGPVVGAGVALVPMMFSSSDGVFVALAIVHLALLTPIGSDGRQILTGLRGAG